MNDPCPFYVKSNLKQHFDTKEEQYENRNGL